MLNILCPIGGRGTRTVAHGEFKPLIEIFKKPMIQVVVENLNLKGRYIFVVSDEHYEKYTLKYLLPLITRENECVIVKEPAEGRQGAATGCLLAKEYINNDEPLIIANADQWIDWSSEHFFKFVERNNSDAALLSFYGEASKWSFAKIDERSGLVTETVEKPKTPVSTVACVGVFYYKHGKYFVDGAERMIKLDKRTGSEFYVCPVMNELIEDGKKVYNYPIAEMCGLGTSDDINYFLENKYEC
jgi:dTDP-glucose pyrophosphorylase